ncbi:MAG: hypothetical protein EXR69_13545 [Myxococcales bacterium]|nr:hypothetical protein [Myxococcales bacterium]
MLGLLLLSLVGPAGAGRPSDLAPGAPELQEAELRLNGLLAEANAVRAATSRLQSRWVTLGAADECAPERMDIGWRIERFGAAWREAAQAVHAQAGRLAALRSAATVAPLVDAEWAERLKGILEGDARGGRAFIEASVWQARFVRPLLGACATVADRPESQPGREADPVESGGIPDDRVDEAPEPPPNGEALAFVWEKGHVLYPVAVLAAGDGWICPGSIRADDAIVLLDPEPDGSALACWSASSSCGCALEAIWPGGVLAPPAD